VTLSGAGEPTLHSRFGDVLTDIKKLSSISTVLLSNGSLFYLPAVRAGAVCADIVKVSLSAWDQGSFEQVNCPHPELKFKRILEGIHAFRGEFKGQLWIEVVVLLGINDSDSAIAEIAKLAGEIGPDRIHLNTVVRPAAEDRAKAVSVSRLREFSSCFSPRAEVLPCENGNADSDRPLAP
jgi:wyosine [tRNA(Phe)-imidazoG37] synthetase (radical SAM superfamily)